MSDKEIIKLEKFCELYEVPTSFVDSLNQFELIHLTTIDDEPYIENEELPTIEKFIRLHYDLNVNIEGIDVINNLLNKITALQKEIILLENELKYYKSNF
jgi:hypothetical protein